MRKNLKCVEFIIMVGIVLLSVKQIVESSTNITSTLCELAIFAWALIGCVRIDEKNHEKNHKDV